jgi:DNA replication protein DnaC
MKNRQFDEVERLIRASSTKPNECPTCGAKAIEVAPGIPDWPESTYHYLDEDHPCDCAEQIRLFRHYLLAHIPQEYMNLGIDCYYGDEVALTAAQNYLKKWDSYRRYGMGMGFYSTVQGTGKTFLATYLARELVKRGESVYFIDFRKIIAVYQLPYEARKDEEDRLRDCTLLVLDEIARPLSDAQRNLWAEKFEELIRHRSNYNKVTILTTNLTPDELDEIYPRTYSLLAAKEQSVNVTGVDARKEGVWTVNQELAENGEVRPII